MEKQSDYTPQEGSALKQDRRQEKLLVEGSRANRAQIRRAQKLRLPVEALLLAGQLVNPKQRRIADKPRADIIRLFLKIRKLVNDAQPPTE